MKIVEFINKKDLRDITLLDNYKVTRYDKYNFKGTNTKNYILNELDKIIETGKVFGVSNDDRIINLITFERNIWDSNFFGFNSGEIKYFIEDGNTERNFLNQANNKLFSFFMEYVNLIDLDFCLISIDSWDNFKALEVQAFGFKYVLTWGDCSIKNYNSNIILPVGYSIGKIKDKENNYIIGLYEQFFEGGRFFLDPIFDKKSPKLIHKSLIENSINSDIYSILVLRYGKDPIGAMVYKNQIVESNIRIRVGALRLLVFDKHKSKPGLATSFLNEVVKYLLIENDIVTSGIELHNLPSLRIHQNVGFKFTYTHNAYHWWKSNSVKLKIK